MQVIDSILRKIAWQERPAPNDSGLPELESEMSFKLPEDYKDFLTRYCGDEKFFGENYVCLWDKDDVLIQNRNYQIPEFLPGAIGIGTNGAGELYALLTTRYGHQVIKTPFISMEPIDHHEVGMSFSDFLQKLDAS